MLLISQKMIVETGTQKVYNRESGNKRTAQRNPGAGRVK